MNDFITEVEGKKIVDFNLLRKRYGKELAQEMKRHVEYAEKEKLNFKIEVVEENSSFVEIAFATRSYAYNYEIFLEDKRISGKNYIGWRACARIADMMKST